MLVTEFAWGEAAFLGWLRSHGSYPPPNVIPPYKDGGVGRAYFIGDLVVKFTVCPKEAEIASMVSGKLSGPTRILSVRKHGKYWAILQEKLDKNIPEYVSKGADLLMTYVNEFEVKEFPVDVKISPKNSQDLCRIRGCNRRH
jgi:hypothetical protein